MDRMRASDVVYDDNVADAPRICLGIRRSSGAVKTERSSVQYYADFGEFMHASRAFLELSSMLNMHAKLPALSAHL